MRIYFKSNYIIIIFYYCIFLGNAFLFSCSHDLPKYEQPCNNDNLKKLIILKAATNDASSMCGITMEPQKNRASSSSNQNSISTFKYPKNSYVFTSGVQIDPLYPEVVGIISKCSVMPSLPNGLILNSQTCVISGTPLNSQYTINYKVTASNTTSDISANLSITINSNNFPPTISYSGSPFTFIQGSPYSISPTSNGSIISCNVMPSLPAGLFISSSCLISGTPTGTQTTTSYTITANNSFGNTFVSVSIAVNALFKYIFVTASNYNGNLGGLTGADTKCNTDAAKPNGSTYNAMIRTNSGRKPCNGVSLCSGLNGSQAIGWVLQSGVQYRTADGITIIGTANNDLIIPLPLSNSFGMSGSAWTGLENDWSHTMGTPNCTGWTIATGNGTISDLTKKNSDAINSGNSGCPTSRKLICVEQ